MPTSEEVKKARHEAGLTQEEAGKVLHVGWKYWQQWEYGKRTMPEVKWELFLIKTKAARKKNSNQPKQGE